MRALGSFGRFTPFSPQMDADTSAFSRQGHIQKLLTFVLHKVSAQTLSQEKAALQIALRPLIANKDGHFVAAVISMFQSLLKSKTDCPISGVFGAGKTLSAAAMIAGLLVMDPSLKIMIVTKENVAAHAFVKHFLRLELSESINCLVGRLVGYVEMKKGPANQTALDIPSATDIFSPPRFTKRANSFGLKPGYAIDLETCRGNGERWDLTNKTHHLP